jgi:hypothetical protein
MYYSYVEIECVALSFSPATMDLALKLLIKYLEAFMPNDGHKAQSNKVQTILAMLLPKGSDNKTLL